MTDGTAIDLIRDALALDQLCIESQPIVSLADGSVVAEELLVRIRAADGGLIQPAVFIPAAERYGLMPLIDRYVIEGAAALAAAGRTVHTNLSATTIAQYTLFDDIVGAIRRNSAPADRITFEITETAAPVDLTNATHLATRLAARGFGIALDDFGSGWGAFRYLNALPASVIKIDYEFVREIASCMRTAELVRAIVALARRLGQKTIGEGVEDERTLTLLRLLGVDYAQGFYLGRPGPIEDQCPRRGAARATRATSGSTRRRT
jgi:EAL domain-containing protein (putative c-di-GMP-specific phosphodiesterase class I)